MAKKRRVCAELPVSFSVSFLDSCDGGGGGGAGPHHICRHTGVAHAPEISFPGSFLDPGATFPKALVPSMRGHHSGHTAYLEDSCTDDEMTDGGCFTRAGCSRVLSAKVLGEGAPKSLVGPRWREPRCAGRGLGVAREHLQHLLSSGGANERGAKRGKQGVQSQKPCPGHTCDPRWGRPGPTGPDSQAQLGSSPVSPLGVVADRVAGFHADPLRDGAVLLLLLGQEPLDPVGLVGSHGGECWRGGGWRSRGPARRLSPG